jgi:ribonuclease P protein component
MVVPKYKRTGVERNRLKRRLREIARTRVLPGLRAAATDPAATDAAAVDVVVRALPPAYDAPFDRLREELVRSVERVVRRVREQQPGAAS